ncbi:protoporphyrinogen oxidase [Gemmata sp. JC717]|uniref:protoporphyrinogen oxidase n=1 Tax=Gemmata algarum TaxID=2975278 RepID=UPI0021BA78A4|nr:protoporphyrinogen oxidase [Gemmata algarum]MDY3555956.1 protoporphyrinogen oxidase [Gemmata algarum]
MPHVVVVGGGLSGLTVALRLKQFSPGTAVTVLEPRDRPGGNIYTESDRGFRVEHGPNGYLDRTPALPNLVRELGLEGQAIAASDGSRKNRYVFLRNKLRKLPGGPLGLLTTSLLSLRGKWQLLAEPWRKTPPPGHEETIQEFVTRRAGSEAANVFADALVTGIHGGDPALLSVSAAFPRLPVMERDAGSIVRGFMRAAKKRKEDAKANNQPPPGPMRMWSFRDGLQVLVDALAAQVGSGLHCGTRVEAVSEAAGVAPWTVHGQSGYTWSADAVVLACPSYEQAGIVSDINPELSAEMAAIPYNRIAVVALGYRAEHCPGKHDGFGYIAPQNTRRDLLGVQWCSSIFPDRAPQGFVLWRALCGGVHRAEQIDWPDEQLVKAVHGEITLAMGVTGTPVFKKVVRWPNAIPQYVLGHLDRVARIDALASRHPGLFLTGNSYRGVAMADCVEQGEAVAAKVALHLQRAKPR